MQDEIYELKQAIGKMLAVSEIYEETLSKKIETDIQMEEAKMKLKLAAEQVLKLTLECKEYISKLKKKQLL